MGAEPLHTYVPITGPAIDPPGKIDLYRRADGWVSVLAGGANVVMQLSWPEVGRGVVESKVESGRADRHPIKRARTTLTYLAVALYGDDTTRAAYRRAIDSVHVQVRSDESSPVKYNAFNRDLQLWVASCLYYGARDAVVRAHGPLSEAEEAAWFRAGRRFGTTLQVPAEMWHADLESFKEYWAAGMERMYVDEETRKYLLGILSAGVLPGPLSPLGRLIEFFNTGFLPEPFRELLGVTWTRKQERRHALALRGLGALSQPLPDAVRKFPFNALLLDLKWRQRRGRPLV